MRLEYASFLFTIHLRFPNLKKIVFILFASSIIYSGCDTSLGGSELENQPPRTFLTVSNIDRGESERLSSQISISWWGNDPDGFIVGYEYAINDTTEGAWSFTRKTDSVFVLPISFGQDVDNVLFKVRAIDNDGAIDRIGAKVVYPIRNSDPTVQINIPTKPSDPEAPADTTFNINSFEWQINDPDGLVNLQRTEIAFNDKDGNWTEIPIEDNDRIFISVLVKEDGTSIFRGRNFTQTDIEVEGIMLDALNTFYVRTIDQAGAVSEVDSVSWYIKNQNSDILFLNDVDLSNKIDIYNYHSTQLSSIGIDNFDYWDIGDEADYGGGRKAPLSGNFPSVIDPTLIKSLAQWDHIYWISNDLDRNLTYAQEILEEFFDNGGTLFINIPSKNLASSDPLLNLLPITEFASFSGLQTGPLIRSNSEVTPVGNGSLPVLRTTQNITSVYSFGVGFGTIPLYEAEMRARLVTGGSESFEGVKNIALENPEGTVVYFGIDLRFVDGDGTVDEFLDYFLKNELCFDGSCE